MQLATRKYAGFAVLGVALMLFIGGAPSAPAHAQNGPLPDFPIDHYLVYRNLLTVTIPAQVTLMDQFGTTTHTLQSMDWFGVPVDKNQEGILFLHRHYSWWRISDGGFEPQTVVVQNQFGDYTLVTGDAEYLLAPALKNSLDGVYGTLGGSDPVDGDHYKCYQIVEAEALGIGVSLADQFGVASGVVFNPLYLCNPAEKILPDGRTFSVANPDDHLVCYLVDSGQPGGPIQFSDQFGSFPADLEFGEMLCVPSKKDRVVQTNEGSWGEIKSMYR